MKNKSHPIAKKITKKLVAHGDVRTDNYYWLNDREDPEVIDYLNKENDYLNHRLKQTENFQKLLFEEMKGRIKEDDSSVPYKYNGYWYITKYEKNKDYPIYTRKKEHLDAEEELLFDCNVMAEGHSYFRLVGLNVSPDNNKVAFGVDTVSRRQYAIQIKDLRTGTIYPEKIENTTGGSTWANDNDTLFYARKDEQTLRSDKIFRHDLETETSKDVLVYEEEDETFNTYVYKTKSRKYLIIASFSTLSNEYRILDADKPYDSFKIFQPRERELEYEISHYKDHFYILTNKDKATNFKLMKTSELSTEKENWVDLIPHREDVLIEGIDIFNEYLVISERKNGLSTIFIQPWNLNQKGYYLPFDNETYTAFPTTNVDFDTNVLRYAYNSLTTPSSIIDFNMSDKTSEVKKEQEILGGKFKKENYVSERLWAPAQDGKKVPISLVYRKDLKLDGNTPLLLYAYGSYGATIDPSFSSIRLSLLDRGFIFAIAHIRGSQYLGRPWYEDGKLFNKMNTFTDFVDCSKYLIERKYTSPEHHYAMGGSAGGLLMGVVVNMASELYNGIIAAVPFVDVVTTMLDDSIPLTTGEYDEWGDPHKKECYEYMRSYSPYDHVIAKDYPNMLVTAGFHDSQVQYWEPAKWVAKLREVKTDDNLLLLRTNMDTGHGGASGRFESLKEDAQEYAFLFQLEGITA